MDLRDKLIFIHAYLKDTEKQLKTDGDLILSLHLHYDEPTISVFKMGTGGKECIEFSVQRTGLSVLDDSAVSFSAEEAKTLLESILCI